MDTPDRAVDAAARKLVGLQVLVIAVIAIGFLLGESLQHAAGAVCGGAISIFIAVLLSRGVRRASAQAAEDARKSMMILYLGAAQRFILIGALFALGLVVLGMEPLPMVAGFIAAQLSYLISMRSLTRD